MDVLLSYEYCTFPENIQCKRFLDNGIKLFGLHTVAMLQKKCIQFRRNIALVLICLFIPIALVAILVFSRHEHINLPPLPLSLNMFQNTTILIYESPHLSTALGKRQLGKKDRIVKSDLKINDEIWLKKYIDETKQSTDRELLGAVNQDENAPPSVILSSL